jgi:hypothetical protein
MFYSKFLFFTLLIITIILNIESRKIILDSEKHHTKRITEINNNLETLLTKIKTNKENIIALFYADWCSHW